MFRNRKNKIQKISAILVLVLFIGSMLCGCARKLIAASLASSLKVETSTKYLIGFDYSSYKDVFGMAPVITCTVRYDKTVDASFVWINQNGERSSQTLNFALTDSQFSNISQSIDPQEVYYLNPKCADPDDVCDGGSSWLYVYGPDDTVLKECGGFCPGNERFHEIRRILFDNLPEELIEVYSRYEEIYDTQFGKEENSRLDEELRFLFEETYSQYIKD